MSQAENMSTAKRSRRLQSPPKGPLNFRLAPALIREVKIEAAKRGLKLNELFLAMWQSYKKRSRD
jgi:predicted HicB family RNase H-like nuclease